MYVWQLDPEHTYDEHLVLILKPSVTVHEAHLSIMHQLAAMRPYVEKHLQELCERIQDETLIMKQHKLHFTAWLKDLNITVCETLEEKMI
jgi:hypothetical protein